MKKDIANPMSAIDQAHGGAFVGDDNKEKGMEPVDMPHGAQVLKAIHEALCSVKAIHEDNAGVLDNDGVKKLLEKCMPKCMECASKIAEGYKGLYPDLDPLEGSDNADAPQGEDVQQDDEADEESQEADEKRLNSGQMEVINEVMGHLEECAKNSGNKTVKAAHKHFIAQLQSLQGVDEIDAEEEQAALKLLQVIESKITKAEREINSATGR